MSRLLDLRKILFDPLAWYLSRRELKKLMSGAESAEDVFAITEKYMGRGYYARIHAVQHQSEILMLVKRIQQLQPAVVVEIGTDKGGTFFMWSRLFGNLKKIASIDLPDGRFGGGYNHKRIKLYNYFLFDKPEISPLFLRSDSHDHATRTKLLEWLGPDKIDFLYIDGDHTYGGVRQDFEMYASLVRPGGVVAFHDINTKGGGHEVYKYWMELKKGFSYEEIVQRPSNSMGIGVIKV